MTQTVPLECTCPELSFEWSQVLVLSRRSGLAVFCFCSNLPLLVKGFKQMTVRQNYSNLNFLHLTKKKRSKMRCQYTCAPSLCYDETNAWRLNWSVTAIFSLGGEN